MTYTDEEFAATLHMIADGRLDASKMVTGQVALADVPAAFELLAEPNKHAKILVVPGSSASAL